MGLRCRHLQGLLLEDELPLEVTDEADQDGTDEGIAGSPLEIEPEEVYVTICELYSWYNLLFVNITEPEEVQGTPPQQAQQVPSAEGHDHKARQGDAAGQHVEELIGDVGIGDEGNEVRHQRPAALEGVALSLIHI